MGLETTKAVLAERAMSLTFIMGLERSSVAGQGITDQAATIISKTGMPVIYFSKNRPRWHLTMWR